LPFGWQGFGFVTCWLSIPDERRSQRGAGEECLEPAAAGQDECHLESSAKEQ